jgi:hypothetical protein
MASIFAVRKHIKNFQQQEVQVLVAQHILLLGHIDHPQ